jgi:hypothetical protein
VTDRTAARPRRGIGIAALVLALSPAAIAVVVFVATIVAGVESTGAAALGWLVVGLAVAGASCLVLGGLAIVLGIVAIVKNRGRGFGIAGLAISAIGIVIALPFFLTFSL